jgi:DNA-binding NtrC family response regulator
LQDDLEKRAISVACVYSPGDENGAMAFAPNAVVADKNILTNKTAGLLQTFDKIERKLPLVLMTGTDTKLTPGSAASVHAANAQIVATIPKPFEPNVLAELIDQYAQVSQKPFWTQNIYRLWMTVTDCSTISSLNFSRSTR